MDELFIFFTFVSIATERLVEFTKGMVPFLSEKRTEPIEEKQRKMILMALASIFGIGIVFSSKGFSNEILPAGWESPFALIIIALVSSGGAGAWNRLLKFKKQAIEATTA